MLTEMIEHIGYDSSIRASWAMQQEILQITSQLGSELYVSSCFAVTSKQAKGYANVVSELCAMGLSGSVATLLNRINAYQLPDAEEIMLGVSSGTNTPTYLTSFKRCVSGSCGAPPPGWDMAMQACLQGQSR